MPVPVPVWGEAGGGPRAEGMPWAVGGRCEGRSRGGGDAGGGAGNGWGPVLGYHPYQCWAGCWGCSPSRVGDGAGAGPDIGLC